MSRPSTVETLTETRVSPSLSLVICEALKPSFKDASLGSTAWNTALDMVNSPKGLKSRQPMTDSEDVCISVNNAGKVRAKRTTYTAQRNQLSPEALKMLTNKKPAVCGLLRPRYHPSHAPSDPDLTKQELNLYLDKRGTSLKQVRKKATTNRTALAQNLCLPPGKGDRYMLRSHLEGPKTNSGLYAAVDDDLQLEEAVYNASKTAFGAEAGVMRMPLEKPNPQFSQKRPKPKQESEVSEPSGYRYYTGDRCYDVSSSTKSGRHSITDSTLGRDQFEHVTQETSRADTKHNRFTLNRPDGPGDYSTRYESLRPAPGGLQLKHEDLSIYSTYLKCR